MTKVFDQIGRVITSMAAVTFALMLTIVGLLLFTHSLFYDALPQSIVGWERTLASWTLASAWELTLLLTTCNTHFLSKRIPIIAAVASGIVVLFFFEAFEFDRPHVALRWFLGSLVVVINWTFTALFHKKWSDHLSMSLTEKSTSSVRAVLSQRELELATAKELLESLRNDNELLKAENEKLEKVCAAERDTRTCTHCGRILKTIYQLNSHKTLCELNPEGRNGHPKAIAQS